MPDTSQNALVAQILSSYLSNNTVAAADLAGVIESVNVATIPAKLTESLRKVRNSMLRSFYSLCSIRFRGEFPAGRTVKETVATGKNSRAI